MLSFGIYEQVINRIIKQHLGQLENELIKIVTDPIDSAESSKILAEYFGLLLRRVLDYIEGENETVENRMSLCNGLIDYIAKAINNGEFGFRHGSEITQLVKNYLIREDARLLLALLDNQQAMVRPDTSLAENALFTGAVHEPSLVSELKKEIQTCDRIELLVSFIKWSGLRLILEDLKECT